METITRTSEDLDHRDRTINRLRDTSGLRGKIDAMCCYCIYEVTRRADGVNRWLIAQIRYAHFSRSGLNQRGERHE